MPLDFRNRRLGSQVIERYYPYLILAAYLILIFIPAVQVLLSEYIRKALISFAYRDLISQVMTIESILFGFLLTVLAITVQTNTSAIIHIKEAGRFNELISFNKQSIYSSIITVFISLILYLLPTKTPDPTILLLWMGLTLLSFLLAFRYVRLFFIIIKE
jgi:hypothetical protein